MQTSRGLRGCVIGTKWRQRGGRNQEGGDDIVLLPRENTRAEGSGMMTDVGSPIGKEAVNENGSHGCGIQDARASAVNGRRKRVSMEYPVGEMNEGVCIGHKEGKRKRQWRYPYHGTRRTSQSKVGHPKKGKTRLVANPAGATRATR